MEEIKSEQNETVLTKKVNNEFEKLSDIFLQMSENIKVDRRIKSYEKETLLYLCDGCISALKYADLKLINTLVCSLELLSDKYACLRLSLKEIKECLLKIYQ